MLEYPATVLVSDLEPNDANHQFKLKRSVNNDKSQRPGLN